MSSLKKESCHLDSPLDEYEHDRILKVTEGFPTAKLFFFAIYTFSITLLCHISHNFTFGWCSYLLVVIVGFTRWSCDGSSGRRCNGIVWSPIDSQSDGRGRMSQPMRWGNRRRLTMRVHIITTTFVHTVVWTGFGKAITFAFWTQCSTVAAHSV